MVSEIMRGSHLPRWTDDGNNVSFSFSLFYWSYFSSLTYPRALQHFGILSGVPVCWYLPTTEMLHINELS